MGGQSSQTQQQSSTTAPWAAAQPMLQNIMGQLQGQLGNTGITGPQSGAINQLTGMGMAGNPFQGGTSSAVSNMLGGGGAMNQAPMVNAAYNTYGAQTNPLASNTDYNPMSTPGIGAQLQATNDAITQQINGQFAGAGRDMSGYNQKALAQGLAAGEAPILTNQYNQNVQNQQGAAGNLYNAGNTTAGTLGGMNQNFVSNQNAGVGNVGTALNNSTWGPQQILQAQQLLQSIPAGNLSALAQMGIPIANLGTQSSGTSNTVGQMSGAQQFGTIMSGIGQLIPKGNMTFNF